MTSPSSVSSYLQAKLSPSHVRRQHHHNCCAEESHQHVLKKTSSARSHHQHQHSQQSSSELIFLGTGASDGIPIVSCLTAGYSACQDASCETPAVSTNSPAFATCQVCTEASSNPLSKNRRRNTSLLIRYTPSNSNVRPRNLLIDCGKFFWQGALEWFPKYNLRFIDSAILTHAHNDAAYGLDDLRDWTKNVPGNGPVKVYTRQDDLDYLAGAFPYLVDRSKVTPGGAVSQLDWRIIEAHQKITIEGLEILPLEIEHGSVTCLGFKFGGVVYLSDVSKLTTNTRELAQGCELLIIDMLRLERKHPSHFVLDETLDEIRKIKPQKTLLVGMCHEVDHEEANQRLARLLEEEGLDIQLSYDGLRVPVKL
jgi:phosphoribosyl 1,2-cyclic phosphodiesterase